MVNQEKEKKRLYDETASLITRQALTNKMDDEELHFLLDLLDCVIVTGEHRAFIDLLHRWVNTSQSEDTYHAIKKVIITTDMSDENKVDASIQVIEELLCSNTNKTESKEESEDERFLDL